MAIRPIFNILITSFSSHNAQLSSRWYYSHLGLSKHLSRTDTVQVPEVNVLERVDYMLKFRFIVGSAAKPGGLRSHFHY